MRFGNHSPPPQFKKTTSVLPDAQAAPPLLFLLPLARNMATATSAACALARVGTMTCSIGHVSSVVVSTIMPSLPTGSLVKVIRVSPYSAFAATQMSQFANPSRDNIPPKFLNGRPDCRCRPLRMNGSSSFRATARSLNRFVLCFMTAPAGPYLVGRIWTAQLDVKLEWLLFRAL